MHLAHLLHYSLLPFVWIQVRSLDTQGHPDRLRVITQQVDEEHAQLQSQTLLRLQQIQAADRPPRSPKVGHTHSYM